MSGQIFVFLPYLNKGTVSAARLLEILKHQPEFDITLDNGIKLVKICKNYPYTLCIKCKKPEVICFIIFVKASNSSSSLEFRSVTFCYPSRPLVPVLQEMNLQIESGRVLGVVGSSGCGKTTLIHLLERFYNPTSGCVASKNIPSEDLEQR